MPGTSYGFFLMFFSLTWDSRARLGYGFRGGMVKSEPNMVTSLTMHPTHPCITVLPLVVLLAPCGITNHVSVKGLGYEIEFFHNQVHQPCRDSAGQHQQTAWGPCASSWMQGSTRPTWGQQETLIPLFRQDFYEFSISVSHSCCSALTHINRNQLQTTWGWRQAEVH